jgi:hypothetical protein
MQSQRLSAPSIFCAGVHATAGRRSWSSISPQFSAQTATPRKRELFHIGEFCHPKALGDANVTAIDSQAWQAQLERLHDICARAFNTLERATA